jgi:hypothetical protein
MTLRNIITAAAMAMIVAPLHPQGTPKMEGYKHVESKKWGNGYIALFISNNRNLRDFRYSVKLKNFSDTMAIAKVGTPNGDDPSTQILVEPREGSRAESRSDAATCRILSIRDSW